MADRHNAPDFVVVGMGRSGTTWLADLLDGCSGAMVRHEASSDDRLLLELGYTGRTTVLRGELDRRYSTVTEDAQVFGEVNSYLRYAVGILREEFGADVVHLVRDGRRVVRSMARRATLTSADCQVLVAPDNNDPAAEQWVSWSRLERLAWYWSRTVLDLTASGIRTVRFEDVLSSYGSLVDQVLDPFGLQLERARWAAAMSQPQNASASRVERLVRRATGRGETLGADPGPWEEWPRERKQRFEAVAGEAMARFGYV